MKMNLITRTLLLGAAVLCCTVVSAQKYTGIIDKTIAVVGNEAITLSDIEAEVQSRMANGQFSDRNARCGILETMLQNKIFLMQARVDSLKVDQLTAEAQVSYQLDYIKTRLGGEEEMEKYFGKPLYKIRQEWRDQAMDQSLVDQEKRQVASKVPDLTPYDVKQYLDSIDKQDLPIVPIKYQLSQICIYPDREAASLAVKEKLLSIRERIMNGEKFATLARIYSEDPGSARRGGELGMASKSIYWPAFTDAAMSLKPGVISQIVETPDGYHIIEVIDRNGDMFNARHILLKPQYTADDREKAFRILDSLRTEINNGAVSFELAARFYSEDPATRTNGGQMADPGTGSSYFEIDQLKPQDYIAIQDLKEGEITIPVESVDNEGYEHNRTGNVVYKIIRVDKILPAHPATFENDYSTLLDDVETKLRLEAIDRFLEEKILSTHIVIDPMFKDCEFTHTGWADKFKK